MITEAGGVLTCYFESANYPNGPCRIAKSDKKGFKKMLVFKCGSTVYYNNISDYHVKHRIYRLIN